MRKLRLGTILVPKYVLNFSTTFLIIYITRLVIF